MPSPGRSQPCNDHDDQGPNQIFNEERGFGFVRDSAGAEHFARYSAYAGPREDLVANTAVLFTLTTDAHKPGRIKVGRLELDDGVMN
jgi:cold shock CspA family protein